MMYALWVVLPGLAVLSCLIGHVWRYRHDRFGSVLYGPHTDATQRVGMRAFRIGLPMLFFARVTEVFASGPHSRPEGSIKTVLTVFQLIGCPLAVIGAGLLLVPPLIAADVRVRVTPLDRITLPLMVAALISAVLVRFDPYSTDDRYRTAETLFAWVRSLLTLHPDPAVMQHAPLVYQARGLILMALISIWPYTRLAGIFAVPAVRLLRQIPRSFRHYPIPG
ncbi:respiratory nitrate reductase subunit gamma [Nocardia sp. NPDC051030]|uniref:respiratory nitrate reductase subunit gamma n=1 Tax=Nocardia sp. NPDC051030 TaxID=3155162 RepID=UPI0034414651